MRASMRPDQQLLILPQNRGIDALIASMPHVRGEAIDELVTREDVLNHRAAGQDLLDYRSGHDERSAVDGDARQLFERDAPER